MTHLWERLAEAKKELKPVQSKYRVMFEDPNDLNNPVAVLVPDPNWMAAALKGGILPPIEAYLEDAQTVENYAKERGTLDGFNWRDHDVKHPYAKPTGPMTEEQAIEYLIMKDVPTSVWRDYRGNRTILAIVPKEAIPQDRTNRNAWKIDQMEVNQCQA
tara:strand:- start:550 stop:1026 length:477 start_codon:yes stop_codon:yes gene_type:complete